MSDTIAFDVDRQQVFNATGLFDPIRLTADQPPMSHHPVREGRASPRI
ncbi:hypothetical protein [Paraburkholderia sp.]